MLRIWELAYVYIEGTKGAWFKHILFMNGFGKAKMLLQLVCNCKKYGL
jgi:hypothetical protein